MIRPIRFNQLQIDNLVR